MQRPTTTIIDDRTKEEINAIAKYKFKQLINAMQNKLPPPNHIVLNRLLGFNTDTLLKDATLSQINDELKKEFGAAGYLNPLFIRCISKQQLANTIAYNNNLLYEGLMTIYAVQKLIASNPDKEIQNLIFLDSLFLKQEFQNRQEIETYLDNQLTEICQHLKDRLEHPEKLPEIQLEAQQKANEDLVRIGLVRSSYCNIM